MTNLDKLTEKVFDIAIIGAGLNGAGIALDAALRGLSVLLIDKDDFGSHTTSASTKLIHGGLRYLEYFEFGLVRESLVERERLLKNAPHLLWPIKINLPIYKHSKRGPLMIKAGMIFYDLFSLHKSLPTHDFNFRKNALLNVEPSINQDGLKAIASYYDCQVGFPERLCLEVVLSAEKEGAYIFNHCELIKYNSIEANITELFVKNKNTNKSTKLKAKIVVNAGGIFVDKICDLVDEKISRKMGGTKGSHILINRFEGGPKDALYVEARQDGRPFFIIPWREFYLVGTTDIFYDGDLNRISTTDEEILYLLQELNYLIPRHNFSNSDVLYTYSGVRPLPHEPGKKESQVTRKHIVFDHEKHDGNKNLISIIGGKLTTYRNLAEDCVDLICKKIGSKQKCSTKNYRLTGGRWISNFKSYVSELSLEYSKKFGISRETVAYLIRYYGANFKKVLELTRQDSSLKERICEHNLDIKAQIAYAIKFELAKNLEDILIRRTGIGTSKCLGLDCVENAAEIVATYLNWDKKRLEESVHSYKEKIRKSYLPESIQKNKKIGGSHEH